MATFFQTQEDKVKALRLVAAIAQLGTVLDEICFTPLRDIQVFFQKTFLTFSGPGEPIITALLLATSFTAAIPYLAKIFNENETSTLQDLLANSEKELGTKYFGDDKKLLPKQKVKLETYFKENLTDNKLNNHFGYLDVDIIQKQKRRFKNFFRKEEVCDVKYKFNPELSEILRADEELIALIKKGVLYSKAMDYEWSEAQRQFIEKARRLDDTSKKLIENMIPQDGTLAQGRKEATARVKDFKASDAPLETYETTNGISFQYWLVFFVFDMVYSQDDATKWNLTAQFVTVGAAITIFAVKLIAKIVDWFKRRKKDQQAQDELKDPESPIKYASKSLKQKQLNSLFNRDLKEANLEKLKDPQYRISRDIESMNEILSAPLPEKSLFKRIRNKFFSVVKRIDEYENIIKQETKTSNNVNGEYQPLQDEEKPKPTFRASATRILNAINVTAGMGIGFSFIEWVLTVTIAAISLAVTGAKTVANFLNGLGGGLIGLGAFVLGTVLGIVYYRKKVKPGLDKAREDLHEKYNDPKNTSKITRLKELEQQNTNLRKFLKANGVSLLPTMKIYDDRAYRRSTTQKTKGFTYFKKTVNRFSVFVGKVGSGILLYRFLPLAICSLCGISLAVAAASVFWPITALAFAVGLAWGIMYTYKYIQERRIESAKRFLDRLDVTLETAEAHNVELREQCKPIVQAVAVPIAEAVGELVGSKDDTASPEAILPAQENKKLITDELITPEIHKFSPIGNWSPNIFTQKHCRAEAEKITEGPLPVHQNAPAC